MENNHDRRSFLRGAGLAAASIGLPTIASTNVAASDNGDFAWPLTGYITSTYWDTRDGGSRYHRGIDLDYHTGDPIRASRAGTVTYAGNSGPGYGYQVKIDHGDGYRTRYAHCQYDLKVSTGQWVNRHQHIADVGASGGDYGAHVHFDIKRDGSYVEIPGNVNDFVYYSNSIPKDFPGIGGGGGGGGYSWPTYSYGDQEEAVYSIQYLLEQHGYSLNYHDGIYGSEVQNNIESFQSANGLAVDGVVGPNTWEALYVTVWDANNDPWWATYGAQHHLRYGQGYSISVDGYYGSETENAVRDFQSNAGIGVDGVIGHDTWQALMAL